ncbi:4-(cytidine 5'-diphospho)-2-C-methyl-D-erythritol kinase [Marinihelvus fidelis]|uniref:4-diphosphocytidyl-2-C-methyl-D-erythritol kinase n=1 Tax=Marinihelvus fidelis TaxID=2613842 RepID=A0A5N0TBS1_9GAMM|nr:4-(cytidine 5'-diphospho)-2-C-methyl-D-erythritol kinase [Marinihelvus fidelis]KAA9132462.1 4-(cytidine 5'-diphospho)-2-C-methyl-D-erythritol kinase [Marinihelvus fidelis]
MSRVPDTERPWPAPAKLNLFLHVTGRRADGYHELQTVFQLLDWGDDVHIEVREDGYVTRARDLPGVSEEQDLSLRAARLLQSECGVRAGARIGIEKRIPMGSGLGGASSDAATVLVALNRLWGCHLPNDDLAQLGLCLGADVPVFVRGYSAWAEGVGEVLRPVRLGNAHFVVVTPGVHVSTAQVFAEPALSRSTPRLAPVTCDQDARAWMSGTRNDCEAVVRRQLPALDELARELGELGPARMTGTGSAFFIPFDDEEAALRVTTRLETRYNARAARGVDRSALLDRLEMVAAGGR